MAVMKRSFNKFASLGSIADKFRDYKNHHSSSHAGTKRKTKRQIKRLAAKANRRYVKTLTIEELADA